VRVAAAGLEIRGLHQTTVKWFVMQQWMIILEVVILLVMLTKKESIGRWTGLNSGRI